MARVGYKAMSEMKSFRMFKSFISLVKASALRDGRKEVHYNDVGRIAYLSRWMNLRTKAPVVEPYESTSYTYEKPSGL